MYKIIKHYVNYKKKRTPNKLQLEHTECGAVALNIILEFYGKYVSTELIRKDCIVGRDGSKASNIIKAAKKYGFTSEGYSLRLRDLKDVKLPAIIHWDFNHFVVLEHFNDQNFYINDPAIGHIKIQKEKFKKKFTGILISIEPGPRFKKDQAVNSEKSYIMDIVTKHKFQILLLLSVSLILSPIPLVNSGLEKNMIDLYVIEEQKSLWKFIFYSTLILGFISLLGGYIFRMLSNKFLLHMLFEKINLFISRLLSLPIVIFYVRNKGEIISRLDDIKTISKFILNESGSVLISLLMVFIATIGIFLIDSHISFIVFLVVLLNFTLRIILKSEIEEYYNQDRNTESLFYSHILYSIKNLDTLQCHGLGGYFLSNALRYQVNLAANKYYFFKYRILFLASSELGYYVCLLSIFIYGGYMVTLSILSIGDLVAINMLYYLINSESSNIMEKISNWQSIKASILRINDTLNYPIEIEQGDKNVEIKQFYSMEFQQVCFSYDDEDKPILDNISFKIYKGDNIGFIGQVGSGKSTIIKLILGLFFPVRGKILVNNVKLDAAVSRQISKKIGYVSQNITLFSGSLYDNLTFFQYNVEYNKAEKILVDVGLGYLLERGGIFMRVIEGGNNLSGGEKQRIEIARVLIFEPEILILDEATSALDEETENNILNLLEEKQITIINVTHSDNVIQRCNKIIDLNSANKNLK